MDAIMEENVSNDEKMRGMPLYISHVTSIRGGIESIESYQIPKTLL